MLRSPLFDPIEARISRDREEGDIAYFHALSLQVEYVTKIVTAGVTACIGDDIDRHRYSLEHRLVRASAIGDWVEALTSALTGPPSQFFDPEFRDISRELNERVGGNDWRYVAVSTLDRAARHVGIDTELGAKASLRQYFELGARIRNRTRGHGAITSAQCGSACVDISDSLQELMRNLRILQLPWVYLRRNLSGKYNVSPLLGDAAPFKYLTSSRDVRLPDGVFLYLARPLHVSLVFCDPDLRDVFLPNGNHRANTFEALSYVTNEVARIDGTPWSDPPARLPPSDTEGAACLDQIGNVFGNLPPKLVGHVPRTGLEATLRHELRTMDRHPIISLTGPGGIGKTTIAIAAIHEIAFLEQPPYQVILWISARDIDLLESGPKPVSPKVVTQRDIALAAVELLEPTNRGDKGFRPETYFQDCLATGAAGTTLFVLDNFETLESPTDVFKWVDTYIRPPNKVLITTRSRDFAGDYPIEIGGMSDDEAYHLIDQESRRLGISALLTARYKELLVRESDGHPYVIKILLGQVAKEQKAVSPERIVATSDHLLKALFERTYSTLAPASQRVFLLLCSWRVFVPEVALEAVLLRPGNERFDVTRALDELRRFSLVDRLELEEDGHAFIGVPMTAAMFGRRKLEVSPFKVAIEDDRKLLMEFGAVKRDGVPQGVLPRIEAHIRAVAGRANTPDELEGALPVLEYLAARFPKAYLRLAQLTREVDNSDHSTERAKRYLLNYLEQVPPPERQEAWHQLADICHTTGDAIGEVHALSEAALLPTVSIEDMGVYANRLNTLLRELKEKSVEEAWSMEVRSLINRVIVAMERRIDDLSAANCSRLAWLHLNLGHEDRARDIAKRGIKLDSSNEHCMNLMQRLGL